MSIRDDLDRVFGPRALSLPVFYSHEKALRFELGGGEVNDGYHPLDLFCRAFDRSRTILGRVFAESTDLICILRIYPGGHVDEESALRRAAILCGINIPSAAEEWFALPDEDDIGVQDGLRVDTLTEEDLESLSALPASDEDEQQPDKVIAFMLPKSQLHRVLFGKMAAELGVRPAFPFALYLVDFTLGVLAWPYDDRGMDLMGPNEDLLRQLYLDLSEYLLDYDRERMDAAFASKTEE